MAAALAKLLTFMPEAERAKAKAKVLESVRLYDASVATAVVSPDFSTFNGANLPTWFEAWVLGLRTYILVEISHPFRCIFRYIFVYKAITNSRTQTHGLG